MDGPLAHSPTLAAPTGVASAGDRIAPGTAVGEYVLDEFIGAGAMGQVYAGHHPVIGKKVAIKVLLASTEEAAERFTREARAVNQVDHPNVIDVFAYGRLEDGRLYLVMDLVLGESLRARLKDGALELEDAIAILEQIAEALDAAHARGVVHRDLKPDNIMIAPPQRVFVLDFGIAKLASVDGKLGNGTLTGQGTWLGTPAYMAPEQWSTDGAGPASDRYALGVIAFELLSGSLPFAASSVPGMMEQHFRAAIPPLSMRGSTSPAIDAVMQRALAKDPDARFSTAKQLVAALRTGTSSGRAAIEPHDKSPRRWVFGAIGVGTLGLAVTGVLWTTDRPANQAPAIAPVGNSGSIEIAVTSTPQNALVSINGRLIGPTPATLHVEPHEHVELVVAKPGYLPSHRGFAAGVANSEIAINLGAVTRFEGVWKLPSGELRVFERNGERVAVSKVTEVHGRRELFKQYAFVAAESGIAFASDDEVIDPRAPDDKSCHIATHVEYRYNAATDVLELDRPNVKIDFVDGQCVPRSQTIEPVSLIRVDAAHDTVEISAPAGGPKSKPALPPAKLVRKKAANAINALKAAAKNKTDDPDLDFEKSAPNQVISKPQATPQPVDVGAQNQAQTPIQSPPPQQQQYAQPSKK
jgi:predicted Ser/Thr protein kinase